MFYPEFEAKKRFENPAFFTVFDKRHNIKYRLAAKDKSDITYAFALFLKAYCHKQNMWCDGVYVFDLQGPDFEIYRSYPDDISAYARYPLSDCRDKLIEVGHRPYSKNNTFLVTQRDVDIALAS